MKICSFEFKTLYGHEDLSYVKNYHVFDLIARE